jgi:hypothetical protein
MTENIHQLLCTLTVLSLDSGSMTPLVLDDIGSLAR